MCLIKQGKFNLFNYNNPSEGDMKETSRTSWRNFQYLLWKGVYQSRSRAFKMFSSSDSTFLKFYPSNSKCRQFMHKDVHSSSINTTKTGSSKHLVLGTE